MIKRICDLCGENNPLHQIERTNKPNAAEEPIELCDQCLNDIKTYIGTIK